MNILEQEQAKKAIKALQAIRVDARDERLDDLIRDAKRGFGEAILRAAQRKPLIGAVRELSQFTAERSAARDLNRWERDFVEPSRFQLPWEFFVGNRALTVSAGNAGGYLTATDKTATEQALYPTTWPLQLGATLIEAGRDNIVIPKVTGSDTAYYLPTESTVTAETDNTFSQLAFSPHNLCTYGEASRQMLLQSDVAAVITNDQLRKIGVAISLAAGFGTGTGGQPVGIANTKGIETFTGTAATAATFLNAFSALNDALGNAGGVAANRATAATLRARPENTNSSKTVWEGQIKDGTCVDYPARSSTQIPSGNAIVGSFEYLVLVVWQGIQFDVNPYGDSVTATTNFQKGICGYRSIVTFDVGALWPSAFNLSTGVT